MPILQTHFGRYRGPFVTRPRVFGLGDAASDAFLATSAGQAALAAAQAAAAALPAGWTMGDPTSDLWGASYYNGQKVIGTSATGPDGQSHYWIGDVGTYGPVVDPAIDAAVLNAANAAYGVYSGIATLRTASPEMFAILTDPEWIAHEGSDVVFSDLSPELQAKIQAVPYLYEQLTAPEQFLTDATAYNAQQATTAAAAAGPATSIVNGLEVYADGTPVPGGYNALLDLIDQEEASGATPGTWSQAMVDLVNSNPALYAALPADVQATYQRTGFSLTQSGAVTQTAAIQPATGQTATTPYGMPAPPDQAFADANGGGMPAPSPGGGAITSGASSGGLGGGLPGGVSPLVLAGAGVVALALFSRRRGA